MSRVNKHWFAGEAGEEDGTPKSTSSFRDAR
jgi:hypothetical protein